MPTLFIIIGSLTFLSAGYRFATDLLLRKQMLSGRATAAELVASLHLESGVEFDALIEREPTLFTRVLGFMGREEFSFSLRRVRKYRKNNLQARIQSIPVHLSVLTLLVVAMFANHTEVIGWLALMAALFIELLRWALPPALERSRRAGGPAMTADVGFEVTSTESVEAEPSRKGDADATVEIVGTGAVTVHEGALGLESAASPGVQDSVGELLPEAEAAVAQKEEPDETNAARMGPPAQEAIADTGAAEIGRAESDQGLVNVAHQEDETALPNPLIAETTPTEFKNDDVIETCSEGADADLQPVAEATEHERARVFRTCVLLSTEWRPAAVAVHASLRRAGQRNAQLIPDRQSDEPVTLDVGGTLLEVVLFPAPLDRATIEFAAAQSFDWPEAAEAVSGHQAHIVITTRAFEETDRAEIVRIHHRAQAALSEFAQVQAAFWPDAGRLVPTHELSALATAAAGTDSPIATCITLRTFPPEGDRSLFVCDTVGLHGFELPDVEIVLEHEPDEVVSAALQEISGRFFVVGCDVGDGERVAMLDGSIWRASRGSARFAPSRAVIELRQADSGEDRASECDPGPTREATDE